MIDFRYHLVSLISVFLALAVGIVLGAGAIGDTFNQGLASQIEQLRTEKDALRDEADRASLERDQLGGFITATGPGVVSGAIDGTRVGVITDSDSTRSALTSTQDLLDTAGAERGLEVRLRSSLWSANGAEARAQAVAELERISPSVLEPTDPQIPAGVQDADRLMASVAALLVTPVEDIDPETRAAAWTALEDKGLVALSGDRTQGVDAALYLTALPTDLIPAQSDTDQSAQYLEMVRAQTALVARLQEARTATVVSAVTNEAESATDTSLLSSLRSNPEMELISTTDRLQQPDGPILAVLALVEALGGDHGAYGTEADADARVPRLPSSDGAAEPAPVPEVSDGGGEG